MSFHALVSGVVSPTPQQRIASNGRPYTTTTVRDDSKDPAVFVSVTAFGELGEQLLAFAKGDSVAIGGRAEQTEWTGRDGELRHGIRIIADSLASAKPRQHARPRAQRYPQHRAVSAPMVDELPDDNVSGLWRELAP